MTTLRERLGALIKVRRERVPDEYPAGVYYSDGAHDMLELLWPCIEALTNAKDEADETGLSLDGHDLRISIDNIQEMAGQALAELEEKMTKINSI